MHLTLYYLPYSPWSLKARCALRHHAIAVREHEYIPVLGEPALRLRLRKFSGRLTVPVLFTPDGALSDSWEIALFAERMGSGVTLIPNEKRAVIAEWNAASERLLDAARGCAMLRVVHAPEAALESLPKALAGVLGRRGAGLAVRAFNAKYAISAELEASYRAVMREELSRLHNALAGGRRFLLDQLSYADFAMAVCITCMRPLPSSKMGPAMRLASTDEVLAAEFPELIAWRDALNAEHPW